LVKADPIEKRSTTMQTITSTGNATSYSVGAALDDLSLIHACKQGDVNAFDQIVKR